MVTATEPAGPDGQRPDHGRPAAGWSGPARPAGHPRRTAQRAAEHPGPGAGPAWANGSAVDRRDRLSSGSGPGRWRPAVFRRPNSAAGHADAPGRCGSGPGEPVLRRSAGRSPAAGRRRAGRRAPGRRGADVRSAGYHPDRAERRATANSAAGSTRPAGAWTAGSWAPRTRTAGAWPASACSPVPAACSRPAVGSRAPVRSWTAVRSRAPVRSWTPVRSRAPLRSRAAASAG
ncbi:MAG: hypothetical protein QOC94_307 [Actinoplanes sp.]|nr:hypothetical protein [Actinoplanes sp.]